MPAPLKLIRPVPLTLKLPEDIRTKLDLYLWSDLEQRIPKGAYQNFFVARIQEFFGWRRLDLEVYGFPPGFFVKGPEAMIKHLQYKLELYGKGRE